MSKERLEEIKEDVSKSDEFAEKGLWSASDRKIVNLHNEGHINWLIKRVQELESVLEMQSGEVMNQAYKISDLEKQNNLYRKAREEIDLLWDRTYERNVNEYEGGRLDGLDIAMNIIDEALEESK